MLSLILQSNIFVHNISKYLYPDEINNVYASCREAKKSIDSNSEFMYEKVCLHHQPHGCIATENQIQIWYKEGLIHRDDDLPAVISEDNTEWNIRTCTYIRFENIFSVDIYKSKKYWYKKGRLHRDNDLPALCSNGTQEWYINGKLHRDGDLPAIVYQNGNQKWQLSTEKNRGAGRNAGCKT